MVEILLRIEDALNLLFGGERWLYSLMLIVGLILLFFAFPKMWILKTSITCIVMSYYLLITKKDAEG